MRACRSGCQGTSRSNGRTGEPTAPRETTFCKTVGARHGLIPYISETLPTAAEVTSIAPSATPNRTGVRIHRRCRIHARCRIDRIFINHHWRRRYNDRPANHECLGNDGSRLLDNDRWRRPVLVRVNFPLIAWNFESEGREFESLRARQFRTVRSRHMGYVSFQGQR